VRESGRTSKMIRYIIIIALLTIIFTGVSGSEVAEYIASSEIIDKTAEMLYNVLRSVK
jgi:hypothetical protein|tara:strand:- start:1000 stop:1173 length:174 start_codon:yes stop_codon:yes gene_type:complete